MKKVLLLLLVSNLVLTTDLQAQDHLTEKESLHILKNIDYGNQDIEAIKKTLFAVMYLEINLWKELEPIDIIECPNNILESRRKLLKEIKVAKNCEETNSKGRCDLTKRVLDHTNKSFDVFNTKVKAATEALKKIK